MIHNVGKGKDRKDPIFIKSQDELSIDHFVIPSSYRKFVSSVLLTHGMILDRIEKLAFDISNIYAEKQVHFICILKGSRGFFHDLLQSFNRIRLYASNLPHTVPYHEHYVKIQTYNNDMSSNELKVICDNLDHLKGKDIVIVEDIIDSGFTLSEFCQWLKKFEPASIRVAALLERRDSPQRTFAADFAGFSVPDGFLVGYSLDYNEAFRDLQHICIINSEGLEKFKN